MKQRYRVSPHALAVKDIWWEMVLPECGGNSVLRLVCKDWYKWHWTRIRQWKVKGWENMTLCLYPAHIRELSIMSYPNRKIRKKLARYPQLCVINIDHHLCAKKRIFSRSKCDICIEEPDVLQNTFTSIHKNSVVFNKLQDLMIRRAPLAKYVIR